MISLYFNKKLKIKCEFERREYVRKRNDYLFRDCFFWRLRYSTTSSFKFARDSWCNICYILFKKYKRKQLIIEQRKMEIEKIKQKQQINYLKFCKSRLLLTFSKDSTVSCLNNNLFEESNVVKKDCVFPTSFGKGGLSLRPIVLSASVFEGKGESDQEEIPEDLLDLLSEDENEILEGETIDFDSEIISKLEKEKLKKQKKDQEVLEVDLSIDSEYYSLARSYINNSGTPTIPISVQGIFKFKDVEIIKFLIIDESFRTQIDLNLVDNICKKENINFYFRNIQDETESVLLDCFYDYLGSHSSLINLTNIKKININTFMYYSVKDLTYAFGFINLRPYFNGKIKTLSQKRNVRGQFIVNFNNIDHIIKVKDLYGYNKSGLKSLADSVGLKKLDILDKYKDKMNQGLIEKTSDFILYSMNDANLLFDIYQLKIQSFNQIYTILGINDPKALFNTRNTPTTIGTVVFSVFKNFLKFSILKDDTVLLACFKQGILNKLHRNYQTNYNSYQQIRNFKNLNDLINFKNSNLIEFKKMITSLAGYKVFLYTIWQYASVDYLISESPKNSNVPILGLTTGGRTCNERHKEAIMEYGADVDLSGAYGNILSNCLFPVGRPRIINTTPNQSKQMTLGTFMERYSSNLKSGLYKIAVSGLLNKDKEKFFSQDILYSKPTKKDFSNYKKDYNIESPGSVATTAPLVLLREEIQNGFITARIWEVIKKVANNEEIGRFNNLKVISAVFYLDSDRCDTVEELADSFLADTGEYAFDQKLNCIVDTRSHSWYGIPLSMLLTPLIEKRRELKKKNDSVSFAIQDSIKLMINSLWGIITSPYFSINNVIVSEIVTGTIRADVWLISKALNTFESIVDGGGYSLTNVSFLKKTVGKLKRPGLKALSSYYIYNKHPSMTFGSLGGIDWKMLFLTNTPPNEGAFKNLDLLAQQHIEEFWKPYDITLFSKLEHKVNNSFIKGSYFSKAHYMLKIYDFNQKAYVNYYYKLRGFRFETSVQFQNPLYSFMRHIIDYGIDSNFSIPNNGVFQSTSLLKIASWRNSLTDRNKTVSSYGPGIQPGDSIIKESRFVLNNLHFPISDFSVFERRDRRTTKYSNVKDSSGNSVKVKMLLFERYLFDGLTIREMMDRMEQDNLKLK